MSLSAFKSDERIQLLIRLGLTPNQALILCTLDKLNNPATANTISKVSGITREKVYCIMPVLQEKGFVEKLLTVPAKFKAIPLKKSVAILLKEKIDETSEIKKITEELNQKLEEEKLEQNCDEETIVVCKKQIGYKQRMRALENATKSLDVITLGFDLENAWDFFYKKYIKILKRGAKVRIILQQHMESKKVLEELSILLKNPLFELRYTLLTSPHMSLYIIDGKQVTIATSTETFPENYSVICARTPVLVSITHGYFENMWLNSSTS